MVDGVEHDGDLKSGGQKMIRTDFFNQPYIAELLRTQVGSAERAPSAIEEVIHGKWDSDILVDPNGSETTIYHGFIASPYAYHRATRNISSAGGAAIQIPRIKTIRRRDHYLYDILLLRKDEHLVVAVPFHALASRAFVDIDNALAGTRTLYEKLNITNMVIRLGASGRMPVRSEDEDSTEIVVTRCHLAYSDPGERRRDLEQVRLTGSNLGASEIYAQLINPVLKPKQSPLVVTPILLGFALIRGGVRKSGAITDRHGNFKVSVGPGLRQVIRIFQLFNEVQRIRDVVSTTPNVPILQSKIIEGTE